MNEIAPQSSLLKFLKLHPDAQLPSRSTVGAAGLDLYCIERLVIPRRKKLSVKIGLSVQIPMGFYGRIAPRSGLATNYGIDVLAGVVDSDYRGEIVCILINHGEILVELKKGSRIAQLIVENIITPKPVWAENLDITARDKKGFGSSDYF